jgi:hypothetical protein
MRALALASSLVLGAAAAAQSRPFAFRYDVQPWLLRQGCAAAECHGGALGRGGFKLSLFGGDPRGDWQAIAVDRAARRIDLRDPAQSLLLRKPSRALDHGGGLRLPRSGEAHAALHAWLAAGAPYGDDATPLDGLQLARDGDRLRVTAHFHSQSEDVTARSLFASSAPLVVDVDAAGRIAVRAPGEAWLVARFAGRDAVLRCATPFPGADAGRPEPGAATESPLDTAWRRGLDELGLAPAPPADDATLLRRLYHDLAGRLPSPAEQRAFREAAPTLRVERLVTRLLASPDFAAVAGDWLGAWFELQDDDAPRDLAARASLRELAAQDTSLLDGLAARCALGAPLLDRLADPRDRAELFGRAMLGVRLSCARCHDHPLDRWRRDEHLGFAALFVDPRPAPDGGRMAGALFDPRTDAPVPPRVLDLLGDAKPAATPRATLLAALAADPRAFARNVANRVLHELLGRAPLEPTDDHRATQPGAQRDLLDAATALFCAEGYRLRPLVTAIACARLYAVDSAPQPGDPQRDAALVVQLGRREARPIDPARQLRMVERALALAPGAPLRPAASPLAWWLTQWNGERLHGALAAPDNALAVIALDDDAERRIRALFELLLTREPRAAELAACREALAGDGDRDGTLRALAHALILSREFGSRR